MTMNESPKSHVYFLRGAENEYRSLFFNGTVSAICHIVIFGVLIFLPGPTPAKKISPSVVNVNLVSLPMPKEAPEREVPSAVIPKVPTIIEKEKPIPKMPTKPAITPKPVIIKETKPVKKISLAPKKKKIKRSLKKKTYKPSNVIKSAIKRIENKAETSRPDPLAEAIGRLKDKVAKTGPRQGSEKSDGIGIGGKLGLEQIDIYKIEIASLINKNWAYSEQLAGGRTDLEAWLGIKIMKNGQIKDIFFETKSGNAYFDESAYKAVQKSNPLPPLPKGYSRYFYSVGLHFTPSGLR